MEEYRKNFNEQSFFEKIYKFAFRAGREVIEIALTLYYCFVDPTTPIRIKLLIVPAVVYFISPLDVVSDLIPVAGYSDDLVVLYSAWQAVENNIRQEHRDSAIKLLDSSVFK